MFMSEMRFFKLDSFFKHDFDAQTKLDAEFQELEELARDQITLNVNKEFRRLIKSEVSAKRMYYKLMDLVKDSGTNTIIYHLIY